MLCELVPELEECLIKWDQLDDYTKGKYIGHIIGKNKTDLQQIVSHTARLELSFVTNIQQYCGHFQLHQLYYPTSFLS